jgi:hypothetical protein
MMINPCIYLGGVELTELTMIEQRLGLSKLLGKRDIYFKLQQQKNKARTVAAYCNALKRTVYPEKDNWTDGLLDNLDYELIGSCSSRIS